MFSGFMIHAWEVGTAMAVVAGVVGFFVVVRGAAFAAHAIPNGAFAGAAAADLWGFSIWLGLGLFALVSALGVGLLGRRGQRDVATALTLVLMLALGAFFLSRGSQYEASVYGLLFGEILGVSTTQLGPVLAIGAACLVAIAVLWRPLLLSSTAPDVAEAEGLSPLAVDLAFLIVVGAATTVSVPVVGALLVFSLMIGPPAAARSFTDRSWLAVFFSVAGALVTVWVSIAASYWSDWPVGFYVGTLGAVAYGVGRTVAWWRHRPARHHFPARAEALTSALVEPR